MDGDGARAGQVVIYKVGRTTGWDVGGRPFSITNVRTSSECNTRDTGSSVRREENNWHALTMSKQARESPRLTLNTTTKAIHDIIRT